MPRSYERLAAAFAAVLLTMISFTAIVSVPPQQAVLAAAPAAALA